VELIVEHIDYFFAREGLKYKVYFENSDIFLDLEYLKINNLQESGSTYLALLEIEDQCVIYPFIRREFQYGKSTYYDIITPYEYGGEWMKKNNKEILSDFRKTFNEYCLENNILTEFQRINPFQTKNDFGDKNAQFILAKDNVVIDLQKSEEEIFANYHKNNRRDIRLAIRNDVTVIQENPSKESIGRFKRLYYKTMDAKDTSEFYYFNEEYFEGMSQMSPEKLSVFTAYTNENNIASCALVLKKNKVAHYHLSGSDRNYTKLCATNLLLHTIAMCLKTEGYDYFHLGGAASNQEGLYRFKRKFSGFTMPYFVCKRLINPKVYEQLNNQIIKDKDLCVQANEENHFPLYRKLIELE